MTRDVQMASGVCWDLDQLADAIEKHDAAKAYHQDARYHAQVAWMRRMLTTMDMAMEDEGVPEGTRLRIVRTVVYGGPDEVEALVRIEQLHKVSEYAFGPTEMDKLRQQNFEKQRDYVNKTRGKDPWQ